MIKKIETIYSSEKDISSNAEDFYKDYWADHDTIKDKHFEQNKLILKKYFPDPPVAKNILEIGVGGEGGVIISLKDKNNVQGADVSDSAIKNCKKFGLAVSKCNLDTDQLKFEADSFDIVFAFEVFEHFANPQHALEEIRRVLKPEGKLLISTPNELTYHWPRLFYPTLFEKENFEEFLMVNGFFLLSSEPFHLYHNSYETKVSDPDLMTWSHYFLSEKIEDNNSQKFFELGEYFFEKRNAQNLRTRPVEAIDLFRKSYLADKSNFKAKLYLTRALLYRVLAGEKDEFDKMFNEISSDTNSILSKMNPFEVMELVYFYLSLNIEGNYFGFEFITAEHEKKFIELLHLLPDTEKHIKSLDNLRSIYKTK